MTPALRFYVAMSHRLRVGKKWPELDFSSFSHSFYYFLLFNVIYMYQMFVVLNENCKKVKYKQNWTKTKFWTGLSVIYAVKCKVVVFYVPTVKTNQKGPPLRFPPHLRHLNKFVRVSPYVNFVFWLKSDTFNGIIPFMCTSALSYPRKKCSFFRSSKFLLTRTGRYECKKELSIWRPVQAKYPQEEQNPLRLDDNSGRQFSHEYPL